MAGLLAPVPWVEEEPSATTEKGTAGVSARAGAAPLAAARAISAASAAPKGLSR